MKRLLFLILTAVVSLSLLASCSFMNTDSNTGDGTQSGDVGTDKPSGDDNGTADKKVSYEKIVYSSDELDLSDVRTAMMSVLGPVVTINHTDTLSPSDGEVVFGDTTRAISAAARAELEKKISESPLYDCGYIIYCDGKSASVYWQIADMASIAIERFVALCVEDMQMVLTEGVIDCQLYDREEYEKEKYWLTLEAEGASPELIAAYRKAYSVYDGDKILDWVANLYDAEIGGFYFSRSARDYEGFLPDMESTNFAISMLVNLGAMTNRNAQLPVEMQIAMVNFVRNMQSPVDGYYYHPQWPQSKDQLAVDRYGRDIATASGFITSFWIDTDGDGVKEQQRPLYCIPAGAKCALHNGTSDSCSFPVATSYINKVDTANAPLDTTVSAAVSKLSSSVASATASVSSHPDYSSREAFAAWLEASNENIKQNSGNAHKIAELRFEIASHGYMDIVFAHLERVQAEIFEEQISKGETPSGVWQYEADYRAVWGLYKYLAFYEMDGYGKSIDIKYVPYMIATCQKVLAMPADGSYQINDVMNQWTAMNRIISNVKRYYGAEEVEKIYEATREGAVELIENSVKKVQAFKVDDGSFAYNINGRAPSSIYGVPISLGFVEGDLNAMTLALGVYSAMYNVLGYTRVPLCDASDLDRFVDTILYSDPIEKKKAEADIFDFEGALDSSRISINAKTPEALCEIREDPEDRTNNVLYFVSGTAAAQADTLTFSAPTLGSSCNVSDFKMYVSSETDSGYLFQINLGAAYQLVIYKEGDDIIVKDTPTHDNTNIQIERARVKADTWFHLRFEHYLAGEEMNELESPRTKIYLNDELVAISEIYKNSHLGTAPSETFSSVSFYSMRLVNTFVYFDDCYFAKENLTYFEE